MCRFTEADSGASPEQPITYTTAPGAAKQAAFLGGVPLTGLAWGPAGNGLPAGVFKAQVPPGISFDVQDQLFLVGSGGSPEPLVRGRTPNGRPWVPRDGFNLTVAASVGTLVEAPVFTSCTAQKPVPPHPTPQPRPTPAKGGCVAAPDVSLLEGYPNIPGVSVASASSPSASDCMARCHADPCCKGFTWHDNTTGVYYKMCFFLSDPATDAWQTEVEFPHHFSGLCDHSNITPPPQCTLPESGSCVAAKVVCNSTNTTQVTGSLGVSSLAGKALAGADGTVSVSRCLEHLLDLANDWPDWKAASYGPSAPCRDANQCANTMYTKYNYPLWYGPWAGGIEVSSRQDAGTRKNLSDLTWADADQIVVHAMADHEWGGVQFRVASASAGAGAAANNTVLKFGYGGFQQARAATLKGGNRFYMEGSLEFVDAPGEWHFDASARELFVFPPTGTALDGSSELVLTQTDTLFEFVGSSSDEGSRVENLVMTNLTLGFTSAQFFRPHEETSGGDYATHRSAAIKLENASGVVLSGNNLQWVGGNGVFLSASVRNVTVEANMFRWLGTSGVAIQGKTGAAMMDGRDGEAMAAAHGRDADNGVRLPKDNRVANNIFADYGIWDKQSACYHKALAPGNVFQNNVCFNASRHGVNFQDGMGGGGIAEGNVMFNLNRETHDTTAFNSWNRRNYLTSDPSDPSVGVLVPPTHNEWRRNLVLGRNFYGVMDLNGNSLRNDDGASFYTHSNNVLYAPGNPGLQFNGGTQIHMHSNLILLADGANLGPTPDVFGWFNNTIVDGSVTFTNRQHCSGFWRDGMKHGVKHGVYTGDYTRGIVNSTGEGPAYDLSTYYCGMSLGEWQNSTGGQDMHSSVCTNTRGECAHGAVLSQARQMMWADQPDRHRTQSERRGPADIA